LAKGFRPLDLVTNAMDENGPDGLRLDVPDYTLTSF